ncbi:hypothetical protein [Prosthecobacter dejongeii]|uniref:Uncharacterized protein n=1 Tax=Prosthecobacter dejongeii TaxID=48465 RepID=A0A7W8DSA2_9BACT|nr:hypothetical protein [Prosthecobacter dejongeii]MBB5040277.1 hypothetical protein [Prosthecobacter dejongeii]
MLGNSILPGFWPYIAIFWLSPLIWILETAVLRLRHRNEVSGERGLAAVFVANVVSAIVGMALAESGIRGFEDVSATTRDYQLVAWAWAMSCVTEYAVLRLFVPKVRVGRLIVTSLWMNVVSYIPVVIYVRSL